MCNDNNIKNSNKIDNKIKPVKKKLKYKSLNTKNWGIDFDKNEYKEIILSNSNHPELM